VGYTVSDTGTGTARVDLYAKGPGEAGYSKVASHSDGAGSGTFTYTADHGDGSYAFYTVALDTAGNEEAAPATADASTLVDGAAPTSQATADPVAAGSPVTVDFTASDAASGIARVDLYARAPGETDYAKVASRNGLESGSFSYEVFAGDGTYRFYTRAVDGAGNVEDAPAGPDATVAVDTLAPDSSASAPARSRTTTLSVDYATSDEGTGLAQIDLYARAPGQSAYTKVAGRSGSPTSGSFTYTAAAGDGTYRFYTIATDAAGHVETAPGAPDATIDVDTGVPASSASAPATSYAVTVPVSWTASDPGGGTGLATLELYVRVPGQTAYQRAATITDPAGSGSLAYSPSAGDGVYRFYTVATDRAGNAEAAPATPDATTTVAVDTVAPASAAGTLALYTTGSPFPPIAYTASDSGPSGLASLELWVRAPGAASYALSATNAAPGASGSFTFVPTIDGLYRFYTVAVDRAGNREAAPGIADASTTLDRAAPTAFQLQSPANSAGYVRATATMALTTAPTDADSGVASVRYQFAPTGTTTWTDACSATAAPWSCNWNTTVVVERSYSVRALATDRAGNTTVASNAPLTVIVDNTRPVAQAIAATNRTGGTAGRPEAGDSVTFTFSERVAPASVLTGWSGASTVVQLRFINGGGGIDRAEVWRADGTARLAVANPLTLNGDYVTGSGATFNATMVQSNATVVVTLGTLGTGSLRSGSVTGGTIVWTPGATLTDLAGNLVTTATPSRTGTAF
jgi:chitinase